MYFKFTAIVYYGVIPLTIVLNSSFFFVRDIIKQFLSDYSYQLPVSYFSVQGLHRLAEKRDYEFRSRAEYRSWKTWISAKLIDRSH